uniref:Uncharacterized protein n=1 Tax=Anopheles albimanus TaxID=7167 RepID=A0A182FS70_ANOAL
MAPNVATKELAFSRITIRSNSLGDIHRRTKRAHCPLFRLENHSPQYGDVSTDIGQLSKLFKFAQLSRGTARQAPPSLDSLLVIRLTFHLLPPVDEFRLQAPLRRTIPIARLGNRIVWLPPEAIQPIHPKTGGGRSLQVDKFIRRAS